MLARPGVNEAGAAAGHGLEFARRHREGGYEATPEQVLAEVAVNRGDRETAARHAAAAQAIADELGMRPLGRESLRRLAERDG